MPPPLVNFSMGTNTSPVFAAARSHSTCGIRQSVGSCGLETSLISVLVAPVELFRSSSISCCSINTLTPFSASSRCNPRYAEFKSGISSVSVNTAPDVSFTSARASVSASSACEYAAVGRTGMVPPVTGRAVARQDVAEVAGSDLCELRYDVSRDVLRTRKKKENQWQQLTNASTFRRPAAWVNCPSATQ